MAQTRRDFIKKAAALSAASYLGMSLPIDDLNIARANEGIEWHRGSCRLCGVGCRVELGVKDGLPMGLRGVAESRTNYGYVCMKGMHFWKCMRHPDRLTKPLYRKKKTDKFQEISWDKALDIAATEFAKAHKDVRKRPTNSRKSPGTKLLISLQQNLPKPTKKVVEKQWPITVQARP